jgi:hypothetical protein
MTQRAGDAAGGMLGAPRPEPGADALFKVGDNLVGDAAARLLDCGHCSASFQHGLQLLLQPCLQIPGIADSDSDATRTAVPVIADSF